METLNIRFGKACYLKKKLFKREIEGNERFKRIWLSTKLRILQGKVQSLLESKVIGFEGT
jgi:hypothetical protein